MIFLKQAEAKSAEIDISIRPNSYPQKEDAELLNILIYLNMLKGNQRKFV